jgi:hypothetical protein
VLPYRPHQLSELPPDPIFPYALLPTPAAGILGSVVPPLAVPVTAAVGSGAGSSGGVSGAVGSGGTESGGASGAGADMTVKVALPLRATCLITGFYCRTTVTQCRVCMIPTALCCVPRCYDVFGSHHCAVSDHHFPCCRRNPVVPQRPSKARSKRLSLALLPTTQLLRPRPLPTLAQKQALILQAVLKLIQHQQPTPRRC